MGIARRLKEARELTNKTQMQVSKDTGINNKTLSGYERGVSEPDLSTLRLLAEYYSVSLDYLIGNTSNPKLNKKDERDIAERIAELNADLENQHNLMMHGEIMDEETRELLKASLAAAVLTSKIKAKEKFTSKKNKK